MFPDQGRVKSSILGCFASANPLMAVRYFYPPWQEAARSGTGGEKPPCSPHRRERVRDIVVAQRNRPSAMPMSRPLLCLLLPAAFALSACDQIAALDGTKAREADGYAVGSACRQAGRAIEDCFTMNGDSPKASIFSGWKDMNDYMIANKLDTVTPQLTKGKEATKDVAADAPKDDAKDGTKDATPDATSADGKPADGKDAADPAKADPAKADPKAKDGAKSAEIKPALTGTAAAALASAASADPPVATATPAAAPAPAARPGSPSAARIVTPGMPGEANGVPGAPVIVLPSAPPRS
jgi:hypothetical protein